ncbi:MAG: hypothetical protein JO197_19555 [Acidobacteria bacterium]|nr:hypothetical protein [Acidobacteriota bacterium]MBV9476995.1 hypothetical protein [Acidobacteriota bacterium]
MRLRSILPLVLCLFLPLAAYGAVFTTPGGPTSTNNDDSCDVAVLPAATLLLPYFEVDVDAVPGSGETTLFTITNTSPLPQLVQVTLWTDYAYPAMGFDVFLTGYDVQSINLYDVIARGRIAPDRGTGPDISPQGELSASANPVLDLESCEHTSLPEVLPAVYIKRMRDAFTRGTVDTLGTLQGCNTVGGVHAHAVGYATMDVVGSCNFTMPNDPLYFSREIRFDNVLTGDYQQVDGSQNYAQGNPMVHIRAIPEGGTPEQRAANPNMGGTNFPRTFYSALQSGAHPTADARQPLPSTFAARWIEGGTGSFQTSFKVWREAVAAGTNCADYPANGNIAPYQVIRFDEDENPSAISPIDDTPRSGLGATSRFDSDASPFPAPLGSSVGGWMYLDLDTQAQDQRAAQAWVVVSMRAEGRYSVDFDASALGNGCSAPAHEIAPAANQNQAELHVTGGPHTMNNDDTCDIAALPAATLLLPYFEVSLAPNSETTLFTVTNVTPEPQIAHVVLWTDYSYPVLSFDLFLTGYDVQAINLADVIVRGRIVAQHAATGEMSSEDNPLVDEASCSEQPSQLPVAFVTYMQSALTLGRVPRLGQAEACNTVGGVHANAIGYATIDVVGACQSAFPTEARYYSHDLRFDNALIGDYQQINSVQNYAQGNPMVHIRAIPEGEQPLVRAGDPAYHSNFQRTFYSRYQNGGTADGRQPLPSTFAARWIDTFGAPDFATYYKIWHEGVTGADASCASYPTNVHDVTDAVRFDEEENPVALSTDCTFCVPGAVLPGLTLPSSSLAPARDEAYFPPNPTAAIGGWMYLNLENSESTNAAASQNWVIVSMRAEGRYSVDFDAVALGNGCSAPVRATAVNSNPETAVIGPAPNTNP